MLMQQCSMLLLLLVFHLSSSRVTSRAAPASMDEESLSRACFDIGAEEISFFGSLSGGIDQVYCQGDMRFTMWEFAKLQQPNLNKPTRMDAIVATSTSLTVSSKYAFDSPQATNSGGSINVIVNYASDSPPNSTACQPSLPAPGACNYRSAARLCREYLTSPLRYCTVHLPILATLVMDPQLGDVTLSGVSGNFLLEGNGCTLAQQVRSFFDIASMRPLVLAASAVDELHLTMRNLTVSGFGPRLLRDSSRLGGALSFTDLASGLLQHVVCRDNQEFGAGCVAFVGGNKIFVEDSQFLNNEANSQGGALMFSDHTTSSSVRRCTFKGNRAKMGGAVLLIIANERIEFNDCVFENNTVVTTGGAVMMSFNNLRITFNDCIFRSNVAVVDGGALYMFSNNDDITVHNSLFENNRALQGGCIYAGERNMNFNVDHCHFSRNYARHGGAVYIYSNNFDFGISSSEFEENFANLHGGAIYMYSNNNEADYRDVVMRRNKAGRNGGAVYLDFSNDFNWFRDILFDSNEAGGSGGAIFIGCKNLNFLVAGVFRSNTARKYGGALAMTSHNALGFVTDSYFEHNWAGESGGAIHSSLGNSGFVIKESEFWENNAPNYGGAVFVGNDHENMTLSKVLVQHCHATEGGAVYVGYFNALVTVVNTSMHHNEAFGNGGGLLSFALSIRIRKCIFSENVAGKAGGGAMFMSGASGVTITKSIFDSNTASIYAGLGIEGQEFVQLTDVIVSNNHATTSSGGGLSIYNSDIVSFFNCSIHHNSAKTFGGGLLLSAVTNVVLNDTDVGHNRAGTLGGGMYSADSSKVVLSSGQMHQNTAGLSGGGAYFSAVRGLAMEKIDLVGNVARNASGGGMYVSGSELQMYEVTFRLNLALLGGGGGIFWVTGDNMAEPTGVTDGTSVFDFNVAMYGSSWATQSSQVIVSDRSKVFVDDYSKGPRVLALLYDYYGQYVPLNSTDDVVALLHPDPSSLASCGGFTGYLTGATSVAFRRGMANFSDFAAYCVPGGTFSVTVSHVTTGDGVKSRFYSAFDLGFRECERGEYYSDRVCVKCDLGSYSFTTSADMEDLKPSICKPCPDNAEWCAGDQIYLQAGYWRIHHDTDEVLPCPWADRGCRGGDAVGDELCSPGYEGALCAVCAPGYHFTRSTQSCEPCDKNSSWLDGYSSLVALFCFFVAGVTAAAVFKSRVMNRENLASLDDVLVYLAVCARLVDPATYYRNKEKLSRYTKENRRRFTTRVRIYIAFYQIVSVVPFVLDLDFPNVYTMVTAFLGALVNFNFSTSTVVTCSIHSDYDFISMLYVDIVTPIVVTVALKMISVVHLFVKTKKWIRKKEVDMKNKQNRLRSYYFLTFLMYSYMFLPSLSSTIFQTFSCTNVDEDNVADGDDLFLRADYSVSCETDRYRVAVLVAAVAVLIFPVGIPAFYFYHLYSNRHLIQTRDEACHSSGEEKHRLLQLRPLRILFDVYKPEYWYWEVVETFYRLSLTGVLVLIRQGSSLQIIAGVVFSLLFIRIYEFSCPYEDETLQRIKSVSLWQIFFIFGCALLINSDFVDKSNVAVVVFMIFIIFVNFLVDLIRWLRTVTCGEPGGRAVRRLSERSSSFSSVKSFGPGRRDSAALASAAAASAAYDSGAAVISPLAALSAVPPGGITAGRNVSMIELTSAATKVNHDGDAGEATI